MLACIHKARRSCQTFKTFLLDDANIDSMFVVIDTSKCPRPMAMHLAATSLPLSKRTNGNFLQTA